jgi:hypothetical protein
MVSQFFPAAQINASNLPLQELETHCPPTNEATPLNLTSWVGGGGVKVEATSKHCLILFYVLLVYLI